MVTALDVPADKLIAAVAEKLKSEYSEHIKPTAWAYYAKTGVHKEKPPEDPEWWYVRAASILRKLYKSGEPLGIETLRTIYGGRKNRGSKPEHFYKASGSVIRKILQQLEKAGLVKTLPRKGRVLTPAGRSLLDKTAKEIIEELVKQNPDLAIYK
jgi:small subunit ribosomal protein S19e